MDEVRLVATCVPDGLASLQLLHRRLIQLSVDHEAGLTTSGILLRSIPIAVMDSLPVVLALPGEVFLSLGLHLGRASCSSISSSGPFKRCD